MQVWQHVQAGGKEGYLAGNNAQLSFLGLSWQEGGGGGEGEGGRGRERKGEGGRGRGKEGGMEGEREGGRGRRRRREREGGRGREREEGEEEKEGGMVEEYEEQLKYRSGSVSRTRVSSHTKNVTPPQPIMQLLKLLFCGSVSQDVTV